MTPAFYLKECTSTNDEIEAFLLYPESEILALYTFHQTKGKGQYGNSWLQEKDLNIAYSFAIPSEKIPVSESLFNFHTAVIFRSFIANLTKTDVKIKYPNDLIIGSKKIAGILTEKRQVNGKSYFITGIGINVLQENFSHLPKAGSLITQTGLVFPIDEFAAQLHDFFSHEIIKETSAKEILENINEHLFCKNLISVFEISGIRQNGIIKNVDENCFLWIKLENDGLQKFYHKEIEMLY